MPAVTARVGEQAGHGLTVNVFAVTSRRLSGVVRACVRVFLRCYTMSGWSLRWLRSEASSSRRSERAEQGWAKDTIFIRIPSLSHGLCLTQ